MTRLIMKGYILSLITTLLFIESASAQSQEIRLWPGKAPGSESWSVSESVTKSPSGDRTISNISDPTLTVFLPDAARATGAAIVIAPGGALRALAWDSEGVKVARVKARRRVGQTARHVQEHLGAYQAIGVRFTLSAKKARSHSSRKLTIMAASVRVSMYHSSVQSASAQSPSRDGWRSDD